MGLLRDPKVYIQREKRTKKKQCGILFKSSIILFFITNAYIYPRGRKLESLSLGGGLSVWVCVHTNRMAIKVEKALPPRYQEFRGLTVGEGDRVYGDAASLQ